MPPALGWANPSAVSRKGCRRGSKPPRRRPRGQGEGAGLRSCLPPLRGPLHAVRKDAVHPARAAAPQEVPQRLFLCRGRGGFRSDGNFRHLPLLPPDPRSLGPQPHRPHRPQVRQGMVRSLRRRPGKDRRDPRTSPPSRCCLRYPWPLLPALGSREIPPINPPFRFPEAALGAPGNRLTRSSTITKPIPQVRKTWSQVTERKYRFIETRPLSVRPRTFSSPDAKLARTIAHGP